MALSQLHELFIRDNAMMSSFLKDVGSIVESIHNTFRFGSSIKLDSTKSTETFTQCQTTECKLFYVVYCYCCWEVVVVFCSNSTLQLNSNGWTICKSMNTTWLLYKTCFQEDLRRFSSIYARINFFNNESRERCERTRQPLCSICAWLLRFITLNSIKFRGATNN